MSSPSVENEQTRESGAQPQEELGTAADTQSNSRAPRPSSGSIQVKLHPNNSSRLGSPNAAEALATPPRPSLTDNDASNSPAAPTPKGPQGKPPMPRPVAAPPPSSAPPLPRPGTASSASGAPPGSRPPLHPPPAPRRLSETPSAKARAAEGQNDAKDDPPAFGMPVPLYPVDDGTNTAAAAANNDGKNPLATTPSASRDKANSAARPAAYTEDYEMDGNDDAMVPMPRYTRDEAERAGADTSSSSDDNDNFRESCCCYEHFYTVHELTNYKCSSEREKRKKEWRGPINNYYRYCVLTLSLLGMVVGGFYNTFSVFGLYINQVFAYRVESFVDLYVIGTACGVAFAGVMGLLFDFVGQRIVLTIGYVLVFAAALTLGLVLDPRVYKPSTPDPTSSSEFFKKEKHIFASMFFLLNAGGYTVDVVLVICMSTYLTKNRGFMSGMLKNYSGLGSSVFSTFFRGPFRSTMSSFFYCMAVAVFLFGALVVAILQPAEWVDFGMFRDMRLTRLATYCCGGSAKKPEGKVVLSKGTKGHHSRRNCTELTESLAQRIDDYLRSKVPYIKYSLGTRRMRLITLFMLALNVFICVTTILITWNGITHQPTLNGVAAGALLITALSFLAIIFPLRWLDSDVDYAGEENDYDMEGNVINRELDPVNTRSIAGITTQYDYNVMSRTTSSLGTMPADTTNTTPTSDGGEAEAAATSGNVLPADKDKDALHSPAGGAKSTPASKTNPGGRPPRPPSTAVSNNNSFASPPMSVSTRQRPPRNGGASGVSSPLGGFDPGALASLESSMALGGGGGGVAGQDLSELLFASSSRRIARQGIRDRDRDDTAAAEFAADDDDGDDENDDDDEGTYTGGARHSLYAVETYSVSRRASGAHDGTSAPSAPASAMSRELRGGNGRRAPTSASRRTSGAGDASGGEVLQSHTKRLTQREEDELVNAAVYRGLNTDTSPAVSRRTSFTRGAATPLHTHSNGASGVFSSPDGDAALSATVRALAASVVASRRPSGTTTPQALHSPRPQSLGSGSVACDAAATPERAPLPADTAAGAAGEAQTAAVAPKKGVRFALNQTTVHERLADDDDPDELNSEDDESRMALKEARAQALEQRRAEAAIAQRLRRLLADTPEYRRVPLNSESIAELIKHRDGFFRIFLFPEIYLLMLYSFVMWGGGLVISNNYFLQLYYSAVAKKPIETKFYYLIFTLCGVAISFGRMSIATIADDVLPNLRRWLKRPFGLCFTLLFFVPPILSIIGCILLAVPFTNANLLLIGFLFYTFGFGLCTAAVPYGVTMFYSMEHVGLGKVYGLCLGATGAGVAVFYRAFFYPLYHRHAFPQDFPIAAARGFCLAGRSKCVQTFMIVMCVLQLVGLGAAIGLHLFFRHRLRKAAEKQIAYTRQRAAARAAVYEKLREFSKTNA